MKGKSFYARKISEAKANIQKWELAIYQIDNRAPLKKAKEATKVVSVRVEASKADMFRKKFIKIVDEENTPTQYKECWDRVTEILERPELMK